MYNNITSKEALQIDEAINKQISKVTRNVFIKEQYAMVQEGYPIPQGQDLYDYLQLLKSDVARTIIISN